MLTHAIIVPNHKYINLDEQMVLKLTFWVVLRPDAGKSFIVFWEVTPTFVERRKTNLALTQH